MLNNVYDAAAAAAVGSGPGFGGVSREHIDQLNKALSAGHDINNPGAVPGSGFALRVESLDGQMKNLSFSMEEIKLFQGIGKIPASNTVEEFNRLLSYDTGGQDNFVGGWFDEGGLPDEESSTYERASVLIKFIGQTRRVTHVANTVKNAHGDAVAQETINGTMSMLKLMEHSLFYGDSSLVPQQFDGLRKQIIDFAPANVIDLRGAAPTDDIVNDALEKIRRASGRGTDAYFSTGAHADLAKKIYDRQRYNPGTSNDTIGAQVKYFQGQNGKINLHDHLFITPGGTARAAGFGKTDKRPLAPTITVAPVAGANPQSNFVTADAGTYIYTIAAANASGTSAPVSTAGVAVVAGDQVAFTITGGGRETYYEIYRTAAGGAVGTARLITRIRRTAAAVVFIDLNDDLPGTSDGFLLQQNSNSMEFSQLLGMTRVPLGVVDTSIRWAQVCYGALKVYAPGRNILFKNVGRAPGSVE